ncbi:MAG: PhoH-like ATPase [Fusobacteriaceae bacterium]|jgi:PhoH-like ATPase|nr:PhoH family protein [Fusobacteriales bacterium]MDN5303243.1 PhoH-like ATPase [Fusobacteriaceae bacterium]
MSVTYIVDTNVIIKNPYFTGDFKECRIIIPINVLEELDKIKSREGNSGFRARQFFRYFKSLEQKGNLLEGIEIENRVILQTILYEGDMSKLPSSFDKDYIDNKLLAIMLDERYKNCILLTNDISMRVKASSLGIKSEILDLSDKHKLDDLYNGVIEKKVDVEMVKKFYQNGGISPEELEIEEIYPNQFFYGYTDYDYNKIIGYYDINKNLIRKLHYENYSPYGITPKDIRQKFAFEALLNPKINFITITSKQGCGKTFLAVAAAMHHVLEAEQYEKIVIGKNTSPIDKWSYQGFTTGDTEEKLLTHFGNYITTFENIQAARNKKNKNGLDILNALKNQNKLEILDISSILGSSFLNKIVIIDEAQSFDIHAMRSIITRIGENSKLILIGDIAQQTISRLDPDKSGLYAAVEWLKDLPETAHITLNKVHRSEFVEKASKIFDENIFG